MMSNSRKGICQKSFLFISQNQIKRSADARTAIAAVARHIPCIAYITLPMEEPVLVSHAPSKMHRAPYLGVHTEGQFQPVHVALHIMGFVWGHAAIVRVDDTGGENVKLVGGVGIPASGIESVDVVLVFL